MRRMSAVSVRVVVCTAVWGIGLFAAPEAAPAKNVSEWLRWLIPLPKEVKIEQQVALPAADVQIELVGESGLLGQNAARKLQELFLAKSGTDGNGAGQFRILLGLCDESGQVGKVPVPDAKRLEELPNSDQAYLMRPAGTDCLVLAARNEKGLFYAALTLCQLLESRFKGANVTIPLAIITDWPDMAERGEWGCSSVRDIEWMAECKMNLVEFHTTHMVTEDGTPTTSIDQSRLDRGKINAMNMVPIISHLNSMGSRGVYKAYPELRGKGERAAYKGHSSELYAPCASNPKLHEIMAEWMKGYAAYGVSDISCWLGELTQRCECEECSKVGQFALEARAFVKAWQIARKTYPQLRIRILLTQGSYSTNDAVLAEVPPEVGVTYYDGGKTYDSSRDPMIYPLLEEYAAKGGWLGCYPQLTPSWRITSPWSCPQFIKDRMTEFVDKKVVSLGGYVVPDNRLFDFNVTAAAEWSWNAHGRDEREFALAWATRHQFSHPDAVADWAVMLGPVSWDLYGARLVERYFFRPSTIKGMISARSKPAFGQGMFRYIPDREHLQRNLATCHEALHIAERVGSAAIAAETRAVTGYYQMVEQICVICELLSMGAISTPEQQLDLQKAMNMLALVGAQNVDALRDWERAVTVGAGQGRFRECVQATEDTIEAAAQALSLFGVRNPALFMMNRKIGSWKLEDFAESATIEKTIDVTDAILGAGTYSVTFQYASGWNGLGTLRAALVEEPTDGKGERKEVAIDEHTGSTGYRSKGNIYALKLEETKSGVRYLLVAKVRGTRPQDQKPGRIGCQGNVYFQRERDPDWQIRLMNIKPVGAGEMAGLPKSDFSGKGIRVGVLIGGYGSDGILEMLQQTDGVDVLPMGLGDPKLSECQVIILTQFKSGMVLPELVDKLGTYIRNGGGVIATHDAVGYRSMPNVCPAVCAGGKDHVRHEGWKVTGNHPVVAGIALNTVLTQSYYDHIQLTPAAAGTVVAVSEKTEQPVAIAGEDGKGRYVAFGLLPGFSGDNMEIPPTSDETKLLLNAIHWCVRK